MWSDISYQLKYCGNDIYFNICIAIGTSPKNTNLYMWNPYDVFVLRMAAESLQLICMAGTARQS